MKKRLFIIFLLAIISVDLVLAVSIGASPGRINFGGVLQGGYAEQVLKVSTDSEFPVPAVFTVEGDIETWVTFGEEDIILEGNVPNPVKIIVQPPQDTQVGNYTGKIKFQTGSLGNLTGRAGGFVQASVTININVEIIGTQIIKCKSGGFSIEDIEIGNPTTITASVINEGNVRIRPEMDIRITDIDRVANFYSETFIGQQILPTTTDFIGFTFNPSLPVGQYWVDLSIDQCRASDLLTISIVEVGGIIDNGLFRSLRSKPRALQNETVELIAKFQNQGSRTVTAKFIGNAKLGDRITHVLESGEFAISSQEEFDIPIFITAKELGRYVITGRVVYNKKLTFEKGTILTIIEPEPLGGEGSGPKYGPLILYLGLVLGLVYIVRKVVQARKSRKFNK